MHLILVHDNGLINISQYENIWWRRATQQEREIFLAKYTFLKNLDHPADKDYQLVVLSNDAPYEAVEKSKKYVRVLDLIK